MDEIFHVPQAQQYCLGNYNEWNDKITTLPGLYLLSTSVIRIFQLFLKETEPLSLCGTYWLRLSNVVLSTFNFVLLFKIFTHLNSKGLQNIKYPNLFSLISAFSLSLFPLNYFFQFLYYTDTGSTFFILLCYYFQLKSKYDLSAVCGSIAILYRQTNVIWLGFCTILIILSNIESLFVIENKNILRKNIDETTLTAITQQRNKKHSNLFDLLAKAPNEVFTKNFNFVKFLQKLYREDFWGKKLIYSDIFKVIDLKILQPFMIAILTFLFFVYVNNGIVVGDRSNHQASFHLYMTNRKSRAGSEEKPTVSKSKKPPSTGSPNDSIKLFIIPVVIATAVGASVYYNNWLGRQVNTPLNEPRIINESDYKSTDNLDRYWGTYRSQLYFGLKTRSPNPLLAGLMWFNQFNQRFQMRHWCDQGDGLLKYGWIAHDGRNFGIHDVYESNENGFSLRTSWVKRNGGKDGGDWTARVKATSFSSENPPQFVSLIFYFATDYTGWIKSVKKTSATSSLLTGETKDVGNFKIKINILENEGQNVFLDQVTGNISAVHLKESLLQNGFFDRKKTKTGNLKEYIGFKKERSEPIIDSNFIAYQISGFLPLEFEVLFESDSLREELKQNNKPEPPELKNGEFDSLLVEYHTKFTDKFEEIFKLREKNFSSSAVLTAQCALSNMLGGIGFFSGQSIVSSLNNKSPVLYWPANLYTAVPSRSFFPRGFLWDEGFHNILISKWDLDITKDIIGHWLDLINVEGWIPREVIFGDEARAKVPSEFWIQNNQYANPPTLFLPLSQVIHRVNQRVQNTDEKSHENNPDFVYLKKIYNRLNHWYDWFNQTQIGKVPFTYRWRGRVSDSKSELNPKTLTSGLDDYPRASHPNDQERHLDLRCWMTLASKVMSDLSEIVLSNSDSKSKSYTSHFEVLKNNKLLDDLHWSGSQYADYGLHSDRIKLVRQKPTDERTPPQSMPMVRFVEVEPKEQFVNSVGYVSLFPMLLELIDPQSDKLGHVLDQLRDPKMLWTNFGLRSLAKNAPLYDKRNTEHDPPYWRSAIWINLNYLALKSLKFYSTVDGPHKEKAASIYTELRTNLINNIVRNYETTGYIWEQYNDITGRGQGSHPFTGWSALVVLIMSEVY
ncbi:unnamed protein product [Brachionus calyciflorus]|uniref:Mannosyl-oligosaccharide glucosidase n=1 Tax=Brachionus calyciflorus TaxID=104777 RepID=A0A813V7P3_9BILA|nr:unnamed protein product [Brachionus calyciflorus]